jgi:hypothetical protein
MSLRVFGWGRPRDLAFYAVLEASAVAVYVCPVFGGAFWDSLPWLTGADYRVWLAGCGYVRSAMTRAIT